MSGVRASVTAAVALLTSGASHGSVPRPRSRAPAVERLYFAGDYSYKGSRKETTCTLRPLTGNAYEAHWRTTWGRSVLKYEGRMRIDLNAGTVSGDAKSLQFPYEHYRVSGAVEEEGSGLAMTMKYTGVHDGPVTLRQAAPPSKRLTLIGTVTRIDSRRGRVSLDVESRDGSAVTDKQRDRAYTMRDGKRTLVGMDPGRGTVCVDPETQLRVGKYRAALSLLAPGARVQVFGTDTDEGVVASLVNTAPPRPYVGTIDELDVPSRTVTVTVRDKRDRDAPRQTHTLSVNDDVFVKTGSTRGALSDLEAGQSITLLAVSWTDGAPMSVVAIERSFARLSPARRATAPAVTSTAATGTEASDAMPDLAPQAAAARTRLVELITVAIVGGARPHVYLPMGRGVSRGTAVAADARHLTVRAGGATAPTPWERLPAARFCDLALQVIGDASVAPLVDVGIVAAHAGEAGRVQKAVEALQRAGGAPPEVMSLLRRASSTR